MGELVEKMSPNRRIFLNIVATYGRSLYGLLLGLFTARWALMALGQTDFGLFGLVGGMIAAVTILNTQLGAAVGRFYAVSVGEAKVLPERGLENCRKWFTTAVVIHLVVPGVLTLIGYPIGEWMVRHFLSIPSDRVTSCLWVWRFAVISAFVGMSSVPFSAMYTAKQEIAELTIYSFLSVTFRAILLFYMVTHPGDWLARYAFWMCMISIAPPILLCLRAGFAFSECRFRMKYARCWKQALELAKYAGWQAFGGIGWLCREQGDSILVNKYFGPRVNAAVTIGTTLSGHCNTLASAMVGALSPAIMNAYGAGKLDEVRELALRTCKISAISMLIFAIPMALEVDEVLFLWLDNPPKYAGGFCLFVLTMNLIDRLVCGHMIAINATGRVSTSMAVFGGILFLTFPIAWIMIVFGGGVYSVGWAIVLTISLGAISRAWFARSIVGLSIRTWLKTIVLPLAVLLIVCAGVGSFPRNMMSPSFFRICMTTFFVECTLLPTAWFLLLNGEERCYLKGRILKCLGK